MNTLADYSDLSPEIRVSLAILEDFIGDVDGKTLAIPSGDNMFIDDGTVDAEDATKAFNAIVVALRAPSDRREGG